MLLGPDDVRSSFLSMCLCSLEMPLLGCLQLQLSLPGQYTSTERQASPDPPQLLHLTLYSSLGQNSLKQDLLLDRQC